MRLTVFPNWNSCATTMAFRQYAEYTDSNQPLTFAEYRKSHEKRLKPTRV